MRAQIPRFAAALTSYTERVVRGEAVRVDRRPVHLRGSNVEVVQALLELVDAAAAVRAGERR